MHWLLDLRHRTEYLLLRLLVGLIRLMPLDTSANLSAKLWRLLAPFGKKRHQRALANLALAYPEKSPEERLEIALAMWENLGRVMAETMQFDRLLADPSQSPEQRIDALYLTAFARKPTDAEQSEALGFLDAQSARFGIAEPQRRTSPQAWADLCHVLFNLKEFIYIR